MDKRVMVVGGGVAGLSTAHELAELGFLVDLVEMSDFPGGHAIQYTCKATNRCVMCGACKVEEKLDCVVKNPNIRLMTGTCIQGISRSHRFGISIRTNPVFIDPKTCNNCGKCFTECPVPGAIQTGCSKNHTPFYAISEDMCTYLEDRSCGKCAGVCPERAIDLDASAGKDSIPADAMVLATGFQPFDPTDKPYGYGIFDNVVTGLEMERLLRMQVRPKRPSDGSDARRIAFIQCVGSRDAKLGHLWCSKVCCGSALRMSGLIKSRLPDTEITIFYMDVQTFGRDFDAAYPKIRENVRMIRAIPGDVYSTESDGLRVTFVDGSTGGPAQENFDMVVLSVGMVPCEGTAGLLEMLGVTPAEAGFSDRAFGMLPMPESGIFMAGAVNGPMDISESVAEAEAVSLEVAKYLNIPISVEGIR